MSGSIRFRAIAGAFAMLSMTSCTTSPQVQTEYEAIAVVEGGTATNVGAWEVRFSRADIAFGPIYFCAAASGSSTLCKSAIAEFRHVASIDGLASSPQPLGAVRGFTGAIQSASYDFGISWFDTSNQAMPAASAPDGHSIVLEGTATRGVVVLPFRVNVDLVPQYQGQTAVPTAATHAEVGDSDLRLEVHFKPAAWLRQLDFDALSAAGKPVLIEPGSPEHNAVLVGIKNLAPPEFRWAPTSSPPPH